MGNWADEAFERLKSKEGATHDQSQIQAMNRQQVLAEAPILWKMLLSVINSEVAGFSARRPGYLKVFSADMLEGPTLTVKAPDMEFGLTFDQFVPRITSEVISTKDPVREDVVGRGVFKFGVQNGQVWLFDDNQRPTTVEKLAVSLLNLLI
jgi:hypothetical protein